MRTNRQEAAAYVEAVVELDDPAALLMALRHVAKAHGTAEVARRADMGDKTLFRALSQNGNTCTCPAGNAPLSNRRIYSVGKGLRRQDFKAQAQDCSVCTLRPSVCATPSAPARAR